VDVKVKSGWLLAEGSNKEGLNKEGNRKEGNRKKPTEVNGGKNRRRAFGIGITRLLVRRLVDVFARSKTQRQRYISIARYLGSRLWQGIKTYNWTTCMEMGVLSTNKY
jgi:hypothetical protein